MICVDASVAIKWLLEEDLSDQATALYDDAVQADVPIIAPPLLPLEVTNVLRQRMRGQGGISLLRATEHLDTFLALSIAYRNPSGLHRQALTLAAAHDLPAAYDAHYLALAEHVDCEFWTDDQRLLRQVGSKLPYVRSLRNYRSPMEEPFADHDAP
ncbi:MAG: type II toxin-antitoxin system VapC family toxin [Thermomicrobiales bacterium]